MTIMGINSWFADNWFKIIAIGILVGAMGSYPYAYYQILRWVICLSGGYTTYLYFKADRRVLPWIFGVIVVLFNPIAPIYMSRDTWQIFDLITAIIFFISLFFSSKQKNHE